MAEIEKINNTELLVKVYQGQRVVTFKDIDAVHKRPEGTADRNFRENKDKFIQNEDYFCLSKSHNHEIRGLEIPNRGITVVTEQGYLMLVKSFTDDLAWDVQRQLVKSYFRKKQPLYWQETRQAAKGNRLLETDSIKEFVAYAKQQGSQHADRYYYHLTSLANKAAGITEGRDKAGIQQLNTSEHEVEKIGISRKVSELPTKGEKCNGGFYCRHYSYNHICVKYELQGNSYDFIP